MCGVQKPIKFLWKDGSKFDPDNSSLGFFMSVGIANVDRGIGKVRPACYI